jgi:hypothetical protein
VRIVWQGVHGRAWRTHLLLLAGSQAHEGDAGRAAVEELTTAYAELQIVATPPVTEAAPTVFLHAAGSEAGPGGDGVPEGSGQGDFLAAVRTELGIDAVETNFHAGTSGRRRGA